jgi:hypothetical protein
MSEPKDYDGASPPSSASAQKRVSLPKEDAFSDPIEQEAWDAYKKIEPHYSNANQKLAQWLKDSAVNI